MKFSLFVAALFVFTDIAKGQGNITKDYIAELKTGLLIVRIEDYSNILQRVQSSVPTSEKIQYYIDKAVEQRQMAIKDFSTNYTFSEVCYYDARNAETIIKSQDYTALYDSDGMPCQIKPSAALFLVMKSTLSYAVSSKAEYYHLYRLTDVGRIPVPKRMPHIFKSIFDKSDATLINKKLHKSAAKYGII